MTRITLQDLRSLWTHDRTPCVSIFLPTHRKGWDTQTDPIRLKNLAGEAERQLVAYGLRDPEARELMAPVLALVGNQEFWKSQEAGLAVFVAPELFRTLRTGHAPVQRVLVADHFHTRPLVPTLSENETFYVLAVSQKAVRLLRADAHSVTDVPLPDAPASLDDLLKYDERQQDFQYVGGAQGGSIAGGGPEEDRKNEKLRYLRAIAKAVAPLLHNNGTPLVFAGVEALFGPFREALSDPHLVEPPIAGNPDHLSAEALRDRALEVLRPLREAERARVVADYRRLAGTGRTAAALTHVLTAAEGGRVDTLFLRPEAERWGHFSLAEGRLTLHDSPEPGDEELLDRAASLTLRRSGQVLPLPEELLGEPEITDGVAAVLRY